MVDGFTHFLIAKYINECIIKIMNNMKNKHITNGSLSCASIHLMQGNGVAYLSWFPIYALVTFYEIWEIRSYTLCTNGGWIFFQGALTLSDSLSNL